MGGVKYEIPIDIVETFGIWNAEPLKRNKAYDKLMIEALVLIFVTPEDMAMGQVSVAVREFIDGFMKIRVGDDADRLSKVDEYIEEACNGKIM